MAGSGTPADSGDTHGLNLRQAVVVIHGIGEQRPMRTLRAFVEALIGKSSPGQPRFFSKPDRVSDSLELRRFSCWPPHVPIQTDFYELYWAHLLEGTSWRHVLAWFRMLLFRNPTPARWPIRAVWVVCWAGIGALLAYYSVHELPSSANVAKYGLPGVLALALARSLAGSFGLHYAGDAARYLSPTPDNIAVRKAIRDAAHELLDRLHNETPRRYGRIIVVGHSLGSIIAYDALSHLWQERHSKVSPALVQGATAAAAQPVLDAVRRTSAEIDQEVDAARRQTLADFYRTLQRPLLREEQQLGIAWRVSDLITLGSPLAHAPFLIATDDASFARLKFERMLPTSPPQVEDRRDQGLLEKAIDFPVGEARQVRVLHHAALFACTRWTNLYYPGDVIGGPVQGLFGPGVRDIRLVSTRLGGLSAWLPFSHVAYWHGRETKAREELWGALELGNREAHDTVSSASEAQSHPSPGSERTYLRPSPAKPGKA